jgi:hypothetical protein
MMKREGRGEKSVSFPFLRMMHPEACVPLWIRRASHRGKTFSVAARRRRGQGTLFRIHPRAIRRCRLNFSRFSRLCVHVVRCGIPINGIAGFYRICAFSAIAREPDEETLEDYWAGRQTRKPILPKVWSGSFELR